VGDQNSAPNHAPTSGSGNPNTWMNSTVQKAATPIASGTEARRLA
jgi:hypothetical protein